MHPYRKWTNLALIVAALLAANPLRAAELDKHLPGDTAAVAVVNVRQLLDSPLGKKFLIERYQAALKQNEEARRMFAALNLDPLKDIDSVVVSAASLNPEKVLLLVHGKFDLAKLQAAAEDFAKKNPDKLKILKEDKLTVYEAKNDKNTAYSTFADKTTIVISPSKSLVVDITTAAGKSGAPVKKELQDLLAKADGKQAMWLAAVLPDELKKGLARNPNAGDIADKVNGFSGSVGVDKDIQGSLMIHTADAKSADSISEMLDGVKGFAKLAAGNNPDVGKLLSDVVDAVKINAEKNGVTLNVKISEEMIEKGLQAVPKKESKEPKKP
jgi:hypothetical protein